MKKFFSLLLGALCLSAVELKAQEPFEGELVYETYENYSDYILKMANSIYFNGVHKMRLIVKGDKVHVIDETTGAHVQTDAAAKTFMHYFTPTKTGIDMTSNVESQLVLINRDINYSKTVGKLKEYTFAPTGRKVEILGHQCVVNEGRILRVMGGMDQTYDAKAYTAEDLVAPSGLYFALMGLELKNVPLKWLWKYDGGHVGFGVGELSMYQECDVVEIIPREVKDEEFALPTDYSITKKAMNAFALMKYYSGVRKQMEAAGIKGGENSEKTTGVHFKTEGEWGF